MDSFEKMTGKLNKIAKNLDGLDNTNYHIPEMFNPKTVIRQGIVRPEVVMFADEPITLVENVNLHQALQDNSQQLLKVLV